MKSLLLPSSPKLRLHPCISSSYHQLQPWCISTSRENHRVNSISLISPSISPYPFQSLHAHKSLIRTSNEGQVPVITFEDFVEKDWSFLDPEESSSTEHNQNISCIIHAGEVEETSRVLVSIGSEGFVDQLTAAIPCNLLLVVHDSLFLLAIIKEKYDKVKCWQGELLHVPEKWAPLDVVFLYFLPALPFELAQIFEALVKLCSPGARVVISHPQGREVLKQQRESYGDVIVSDLPDKVTLQKVAVDHSFQVSEFVDEPGFYLAVLRFSE